MTPTMRPARAAVLAWSTWGVLALLVSAPATLAAPGLAWRIEDVSLATQHNAMATITVDAGGRTYVAAQRLEAAREVAVVHWSDGATWSHVDLAEHAYGRGVSVGPGGVAHAILVDARTNAIAYATSASGWAKEPVGSGAFPHLAVGPDGVPHVFVDQPDGAIAWKTRADGTWTTETIAGAGRRAATGTALFGHDGRAYVLAQHGLGALGLSVYARGAGGWTESPVPICAGTTQDLAVDAAGALHVVCEDASGALVHLARIGGVWSGSPLGAGAETARIAVSPGGAVSVATVFSDAAGRHVGHTSLTPVGWVREVVDPSRGAHPLDALDLAMDAQGRPRLAYTVLETVGVEASLPATVLGELRVARPATAVP